MHKHDSIPWHRQPMVWMLIAIPLTSVVMGIVMITLAVRSNDGLVVDDYYKRGLEINRTLARDARAAELALSADVEIEPGDNRLSLVLHGLSTERAPEEIRLGFYHATRKGRDRVLSLRRVGDGLYSAPMPELIDGRWHVSAETPDWRLTRVVYLRQHGGFTISHQEAGKPDA